MAQCKIKTVKTAMNSLHSEMTAIHDSPISLVLWWPVYQLIEELEPNLRTLRGQPGVSFFPDGTACFDDPLCAQNAWDIIGSYRRSGFELYSNTLYRSLVEFTQRRYQLITSREYFNRLGGEEGLLILPTPYNTEFPAERSLEELPVRVQFRGSVTSEVKKQFEAMLDKWNESVGVAGVEDEGPAHIVSRCIWSRRIVSFVIDAKSSGQRTLNWFTLSTLNFAARTVPVAEISYGMGT